MWLEWGCRNGQIDRIAVFVDTQYVGSVYRWDGSSRWQADEPKWDNDPSFPSLREAIRYLTKGKR